MYYRCLHHVDWWKRMITTEPITMGWQTSRSSFPLIQYNIIYIYIYSGESCAKSLTTSKHVREVHCIGLLAHLSCVGGASNSKTSPASSRRYKMLWTPCSNIASMRPYHRETKAHMAYCTGQSSMPPAFQCQAAHIRNPLSRPFHPGSCKRSCGSHFSLPASSSSSTPGS